MAHSPADPPFVRIGPEQPAIPVVLSVPHAGRDYGEALLKAARVPRSILETLEDRLVDRVVRRAVDAGATAFIARAPRAEIDLNRDEREIDQALVAPPPPAASLIQTARTKSGLGVVPSRIAGVGPLWLRRLETGELARRIEVIHRPYHQALEAALAAARARFGIAVLLDCHSMPPREGSGEDEAPIVFGDRHGTALAPRLRDAADHAARALGYATAWNNPYAGGHIVTRHGRPGAGIHAVQIEIDRSLYLDSALREPGPGFDHVAELIRSVAAALAAAALEPPEQIAAE